MNGFTPLPRGGSGSGASTFAGLSDAATVDMASINGPLSDALDACIRGVDLGSGVADALLIALNNSGGVVGVDFLGAQLAAKQNVITFGTSVQTALAVNPGSAGSVVLNGGVLGTPSSGTLTNCTGLPIAGLTGLGTGVGTALANAVNGSGGLLTYSIIGTSGATLGMLNTANTWSAAQINSTNGAASMPPYKVTGTWFTGGSATTTKPQLLIEPSGTTSTGWSTSGTGLGVNAPSGFTGRLADFQLAGQTKCFIGSTGFLDIYGSGAGDTALLKQYGNSVLRTAFSGTHLYTDLNYITSASGFGIGGNDVYLLKKATGEAKLVDATLTGYAILYTKLPTTNPGPGVLWNNAGTPAIGT